MIDTMKALSKALEGRGIALNIENLHVHMDERSTINLSFQEPSEAQHPDTNRFDEWMDCGDWDEDDEDSPDTSDRASKKYDQGYDEFYASADEDDFKCLRCDDHAKHSERKVKSHDFADDVRMTKEPQKMRSGVLSLDALADEVRKKTDVGYSTVYKVLKGFFKYLDDKAEEVNHDEYMVKKGAGYDE